MLQPDEIEVLDAAGIERQHHARLDLFVSVPKPTDEEVFFDSTSAGSVTLTAGQVQTLRGALRGQMQKLLETAAMTVQLGDLAPLFGVHPRDWNRDLCNLLDLEDTLAPVWASAKAADVIVPDSVPDDLL